MKAWGRWELINIQIRLDETLIEVIYIFLHNYELQYIGTKYKGLEWLEWIFLTQRV